MVIYSLKVFVAFSDQSFIIFLAFTVSSLDELLGAPNLGLLLFIAVCCCIYDKVLSQYTRTQPILCTIQIYVHNVTLHGKLYAMYHFWSRSEKSYMNSHSWPMKSK